jgi:hypothetical protein
MPISKSGRFTFHRQYSQWDVMEARRQYHAAQSRKYLSSVAGAVSSMQTAFTNQVTGSVDLTAKIAQSRIQTATQRAKLAALGIDIST